MGTQLTPPSSAPAPQTTIGYFVRDELRVECVHFIEELKERIERIRVQTTERQR
jgi:hypothetical protein